MQIQNIPIEEAFEHAGECPFCYIERRTEDHMMDFVLGHGASYMEPDIRDMTDREGFCREHFKKMYDYGNALGNAWILKTMYLRSIDEMKKEFKHFKPQSGGLFKKGTSNSIADWIAKRECSCFICNGVDTSFGNYMKTFFAMYKEDPDGFLKRIRQTKGFCLTHFRVLIEKADDELRGSALEDFYRTVLPLMEENMERVYEDVSWFVDKYDYRNRNADWKNSKDAIPRAMQKMKGCDPSLPPHTLDR